MPTSVHKKVYDEYSVPPDQRNIKKVGPNKELLEGRPKHYSKNSCQVARQFPAGFSVS